MELIIDDTPLSASIHITGVMPVGVDINSSLTIEPVDGEEDDAIITTPRLITGKYDIKIENGTYKATLIVGSKRASFTIDSSVDITDIIIKLLEAQ